MPVCSRNWVAHLIWCTQVSWSPTFAASPRAWMRIDTFNSINMRAMYGMIWGLGRRGQGSLNRLTHKSLEKHSWFMPENISNNINKSPSFGNRLQQLVLKGGDCSHAADTCVLGSGIWGLFFSPTLHDSRDQNLCLGHKCFVGGLFYYSTLIDICLAQHIFR